MKVGDEQIPKERLRYLPFIIVAAVAGLIFFGLLNIVVSLFTRLLTLILTYWFYAVLIVIGLLILKRLLFKKRK